MLLADSLGEMEKTLINLKKLLALLLLKEDTGHLGDHQVLVEDIPLLEFTQILGFIRHFAVAIGIHLTAERVAQ